MICYRMRQRVWTLMSHRIREFNLNPSLAYRTVTGRVPVYLNAIIQRYSTSRPLCSSDARLSALPCLSSKISQSRLYLFVVPRWWNYLPATVCSSVSLGTFKKHLKTPLLKHQTQTFKTSSCLISYLV